MAISSDNSFNQSKEQERIRDILQLKQTALKRLENDMDKQINNLIQRKTKMENKIDENASKKIQGIIIKEDKDIDKYLCFTTLYYKMFMTFSISVFREG